MPLTIDARSLAWVSIFQQVLFMFTRWSTVANSTQFTRYWSLKACLFAFPNCVAHASKRSAGRHNDGPDGTEQMENLTGSQPPYSKRSPANRSAMARSGPPAKWKKKPCPMCCSNQSAMPDVAVGLSARKTARHVQRRFAGILRRTDIDDEVRKAILHDNPINFYRLRV